MAEGCSGLASTRLRTATASAAEGNGSRKLRSASGAGMQLEIDRRDGGQRAERPDHELGHVEPGHVLYHHAAGLHQLAFERGERHADHQVARRAVETAARSAGIGGDYAAHGGARGERRVERHHLAVLRDEAGELAPGQSSLHADGEVARFVLEHAAQGGGRDGHVCRLAGTGHQALAQVAVKRDGALAGGGLAQDLRQFRGSRWLQH